VDLLPDNLLLRPWLPLPVIAALAIGLMALAVWVYFKSWGDRPTRPGHPDPHGERYATVLPGVAHSGLVSPALQGTLRSPSFTLTHDNIHVRAAGRKGQVRLVVEGIVLRVDSFDRPTETTRAACRGLAFGVDGRACLWSDVGGLDFCRKVLRCRLRLPRQIPTLPRTGARHLSSIA